jgi:L-ascorbate metabolism protein UlaG (beta-lactamase superfamily)
MRLIMPLFLLGLFALPGAAQSKSVKIRWYGQSFFQIESSEKVLLVTDPHAMPEFGRGATKADVVTISHLHSDHMQLDILENKDTAKVINGLDDKAKRSTFKPISTTFKSFQIRNVESNHDSVGGMKSGKNSIFCFEVDGLKICHLGDVGEVLTDEQIKQIGPVDILMIPVGGIYTINGEKAREVTGQLKPRLYILPMHYGTKALDSLQPPDEFLDGLKNVKKMPDTNELVIPVDLKQPEAVVVLLGAK